jgi:hypothetical protein
MNPVVLLLNMAASPSSYVLLAALLIVDWDTPAERLRDLLITT